VCHILHYACLIKDIAIGGLEGLWGGGGGGNGLQGIIKYYLFTAAG